jgi:hypothetical protein
MNSPSPAAFHNPLPGVPAIESPFFEAIFADAPDVVQQLARHMQQQGFAVIEFPEPELDAMCEAIKANLASHYDAQAWQAFRDGAEGGLRVQDAWQFDENVKRIACNATLLDCLSRLYGKRAWPFQTLNFPVGTEQHFHSDAVHFSSVPERFMCGVWLALEDITPDNGPLLYYPGSHRWPLYTNEHIGLCVAEQAEAPNQSIYQPMWQALVDAHGVPQRQFLAKKGQALIWAANLLHGGCAHLNRQATRWSQVTHYFFENCAYYTPMLSDPFYGSIDFRNLVNIQTGQAMPQRYAGHKIADGFVAATDPLQQSWDMAFDPEQYLAANPDVAAAGDNPFEHYLRHGRFERRRLRPA